ncbi:MAG: hypothetical protein IT313_11080 [Anaerolineales bacterium]|nr:hypothetical protein [Anaerolineales bacterium]
MKKLFTKTTLRTMAILIPITIIEITSNTIQKNLSSVDLRILVGILALTLAVSSAVILNRLSYNKGDWENNTLRK